MVRNGERAMLWIDRVHRINDQAMGYTIRANGKCYAAAAVRHRGRWGLVMDQVFEDEAGRIIGHERVRITVPQWETPGAVVQAALDVARAVERAERRELERLGNEGR